MGHVEPPDRRSRPRWLAWLGVFLLVTDKRNYSKPGPSGDQIIGRGEADEVAGVLSTKTHSDCQATFECPECGKKFPSTRSVAMHRHHRHLEEVNAGRLATLPTKKVVWSVDEDRALLRHANENWQAKMMKKDHLMLLQYHFPY